MRRFAVVLTIAVVSLLGWSVGAASAATAQLHVSPTTVVAGHTVHFSGVCEAGTSGFVISSAFLHDAAHDFAGVGAVGFGTNASGAFSGTAVVPTGRAPGTYTVTARCGGGNLGLEVALHVVAPHGTVTGVPAGSGGLAASTSSSTVAWQYGIGAAGLVLLAAGAIGLARRRGTSSR